MKKIVSLLVAIAMVMGLSLTAFATGNSGSFLANSGVNTEWTAPVTGEATFSTSSGTGMIAVNEGNLGMGTGSVTFNCVEGTVYQIKHFVAGGDLISWSVEVNGGVDSDATSGTVVIESYSFGDFTASKDGTVKLTMDYADAEMDIVIGNSYIGTIANGETINVTAGTTYSVWPIGIPGSEATLTWEYVEGGNTDAGGESNAIPSGEALALGDNDVELTYATRPAQAPYWTYTATENGFLTVTVASIDGNSNLGMAFGRGMCTLLVGETDGAYTNTATVAMMAGETVNIAVLYTVDMNTVPAVLNLAFEGAAAEAIPSGEALSLGDNNVELTFASRPAQAPYWTYTAAETGFLSVTVTSIDGNTNLDQAFGRGMYTLYVGEMDGMWTNNAIAYVTAGETVNIVVLDTVDAEPVPAVLNLAFEADTDLPDDGDSDQPAGTDGNEYIIDSLEGGYTVFAGPSYDSWDIYYKYVVEQNGTIVATSEGGSFYFAINSPEYDWANPTTSVEVFAGDVLYINFYNVTAGDITGTLAYQAEGGDGSDEPAGPSEPDGSMGNPFIITELPWSYTAEGFHDVYANFTATEACTLKITYVEGNYISGLVSFDKFSDEKYYLIYVDAGETVNLNPWGNESGTYELTLYVPESGDEEVDEPIVGTDVAVEATGSIEFFYTPDADGILTIALSADPGFKIWVFNNATDETVGLPTSGTSGSYEYALVAGVEYRVVIIGYYDWSEAAATISYEATFAASELEVVKEELLESAVELVVGEQNVELLPNAVTTLYSFYAPEAGVYTITLPEGADAALYSVAWTAYQYADGNTLTFTATAEGQGFLVGLTSEEASFNVKIEKTGTYTPPAATTYLPYEPTTPVDTDFQMPEGDVTNVDITEAHTAVLGNDGFYHLDTVDGPILYVNLNSDGFTLATLLDAGAPITMRGEKFTDENGDLFCYDYMNMIAFGDYYSYSQECDYYPLNADLMAFFQDYGAAQGWYNANFSNFEAIKTGEFNEESAWMVALVYIADDVNDDNQGSEGGDNAQTGDFGIIAASLTLGLSAICGTALLTKKKEF